MTPIPFLAQENFDGLFIFLFALIIIFLLLSLLSLLFSARGRWYGPVMTLPGLLFSCLLTGALLKAMSTSPSDIHWSPLAVPIVAAPSLISILSLILYAIQKSNSNLR